MSSFIKFIVLLCFLAFAFLTITSMVEARALRNFCWTNDTVETTCQQCAKITKSNIVYPMCCYNEERVYNWCDEYVHYPPKPATN